MTKFEKLTLVLAFLSLPISIGSMAVTYMGYKLQTALPDVGVTTRRVAIDRVEVTVENHGAAVEPNLRVRGASIGVGGLRLSSERPKLLLERSAPMAMRSAGLVFMPLCCPGRIVTGFKSW
jgi:hypothetical protein